MHGTAIALDGDSFPGPQDTTELLVAWRRGDPNAMEALMPLVYDELHRLAGHYMRGERSDHTLQPTALIHEAWLRLIDQRELDWHSRAHFVAVASTMMRRVLLNHARDRKAAKRYVPERLPLELAENVAGSDTFGAVGEEDFFALDRALRSLDRLEPRLSKVVELRLFGGFTVPEAARYLGLSTATLKRDWRLAKAWIRRELEAPPAGGSSPEKPSARAER